MIDDQEQANNNDIYPTAAKGSLGKPNSNYLTQPKALGKDKKFYIWPWVVFTLLLLLGFFWLMLTTAVI